DQGAVELLQQRQHAVIRGGRGRRRRADGRDGLRRRRRSQRRCRLGLGRVLGLGWGVAEGVDVVGDERGVASDGFGGIGSVRDVGGWLTRNGRRRFIVRLER